MADLETAPLGSTTVVDEQVVRLALAYLDPDLMEKPGWLIVREPTEDEDKRASEIAAVFWSTYHGLEFEEEKRAFAQGVIDAVAVGQDLEEVLKRVAQNSPSG